MTVRTGRVCVGSRNEGQKITLKELISVKSLEFLAWELVHLARGDMRDVLCLDS